MQPSLLVRALRRLWSLLIVGTLVAMGIGIGLWTLTGPTHTATASITLIPPTATVSEGDQTPTRGNPLFYLGGLNQARDLVMSRLRSEGVVTRMQQLYPLNEVEVTPDPLSSGPVILITVRGPGAGPVLQHLTDLTEGVPVALLELQTQLNVPESARVRSLTVTQDSQTMVEGKTQVRNAIMGAGFVIVLTMLAIAVLEQRHVKRMGLTATSSGAHSKSIPVDAVTKD